MREPRELLIASRQFASEHCWKSWWSLSSTLAVLAALIAVSCSELHLVVRVACSIASSFVFVRLFVIYHDYQHGAILRDSWLAKWLMAAYGWVTLNPPSVWNRSHEHHHRHNSKTYGASIGSFPIMTTHAYSQASVREKWEYAAARHPFTILFGYFTVFLWGMTIRPFLQSPSKHLDAVGSVIVHVLLIAWLAARGLDVVLLGMLGPLFVASFIGAYLFYAQHNFPSAKLRPRSDWSHVDAALHSSSFIPMSRVMNWLTGNIGFHHVHHLNARIPFYRLPEAMTALEELQSPGRTTLGLADIRACLRLKLWSPEADRLVGFDGR